MKHVLRILAAIAFASAAYAQEGGPGPTPSPWNYGPSLSVFYDNGGITVGAPTGGTQGIGTINVASGFFVNGAPIGLTIGNTITGSCTNGFGLYNNNGVLGCVAFSGGGTVSSVAMTVPSIMAVSGSPITSSGTLAVSLATQTTNKVFASPNGSTGTPTFRALVNADLPAIPSTDLTGQVSVPNGGTGDATFTANLPLIGNGTSAVAQGTRSGSTTVFGTTSGTLTNGHCVQFDANANLVDAGGACTVGGGGGTVSAGSINQLAWYSAAGSTIVGLATANNGLLVTSGVGVPSISSTIPAATQANITGTGTLASGTTASGFNVACASLPAATGDVTAPAGSCAQTVAANAVTFPKFQQVSATSLIGNATGSTANASSITLGSTLVFSGTALQTAAMSGDLTTPANSFVTTLNTVNANTGSFGSSTAIPNFTVNAKGLITAAGTNAVVAPAGTLTGTTLASGVTASSLTSFGTLTSLALSGGITEVQSSIGSTSTDGLVLDNNTLAAAGAQQWSPRVHWSGQGWKTTATAASQSVDVIAELQPVQGTTNPSGNLVFSDSINGGAYAALLTLPTGGGLNLASGTYQIGGSQIGFSNLAGSATCAQLPALTGDITTSAGSCATVLPTVDSTSGTFGSSTSIPTLTTNAKGQVTASSGNAVIAPAGTLTGTTLASNVVSSSLTSLGTIAGLTVTGSLTATGLITNADLVNSGTTVNGVLCTLGSTCSITATSGSITPGTTTVASGTTNGLLYDNAGVLGNLATANNGVLVTSGAGVPSISSTIPVATQSNITGTGTLTSGATGTGFTIALGSSTITGTEQVNHGGTGATTFTANLPLIGNGTSAVAQGTRSGNTTSFGTTSGTLTSGDLAVFDSSGNIIDGGANTCSAVGDTTSATNPPAGNIGEILSSSVTNVSVSDHNTATLTSKSITAGHWLCWASISTNPAGTTTQQDVGISVTTGSSFANNASAEIPTSSLAGHGAAMTSPMVNFNFTTTTTLNAVAYTEFSVSTLTANSILSCQRIW